MCKQFGNFIVSFWPGVDTGVYNEKEVFIKEICERFGGFECKVFDPYIKYSELADAGMIIRAEDRIAAHRYCVSFYYPALEDERLIRKKIINSMFEELKSSQSFYAAGFAVIVNKNGDHKLYKRKRKLPGKKGILLRQSAQEINRNE